MINRGKWGDLIGGVGLKITDVFDQGQEEYTPGIFNILNRKTGTGAQVNVSGVTGVGRLGRFDDGDNVPESSNYKSYTTQIIYNNYGDSLDVTKNTIEDREFETALDEMRQLSIAANYSQDESGMQLFNGGFSTTSDVNNYRMSWFGNGNPLFSTVQPTTVPGGSTQSNASSTGIPFNMDNLETGYLALEGQQTDDGLAMSFLGKPMVIVAPANRREAIEITESQLDPETANNAINVFKNGTSVDMATSQFLSTANNGSDSAWFLVVPNRHFLGHEVRQAATLHSDKNIKNLAMTFVVEARWANSAREWKRTWGSKGDLAPYSS